MEHAKKLILVDPESRSTHLYHPTIIDKKLGRLDQDITNVLNSELNDDEKAKRYSMVLSDFRRYQTPILHTKDPETKIIKAIPSEMRIKAKRLYKRIKPHVKLSDDGELVSRDMLVEDSNIAELLGNALTKKSDDKPPGWIEFADTLKRAGASQQLIANENLWKYMNPRSKKTISKRKWLHI